VPVDDASDVTDVSSGEAARLMASYRRGSETAAQVEDLGCAITMDDSSREDVISGLRALLLARGITEKEFDEALAEDRIDLLVVDRLLLPGPARTGYEVSEHSGMPLQQADRLWRALGFPEAAGEAVFTDQDVEALRTIRGLSDLGVSSHESSVQVTRVLGSSMARLADAFVAASDAATSSKPPPAWANCPEDDGLLLAESIAFSAELVTPSIEKLLIYAWRRHIQAAARRRASIRRDGTRESSMLTRLTVGFADMVGFTALSSQLSAEALARVVDRFEEIAHTTVIDGRGRPVKMIGDEVMFVTTDPADAVHIGLHLVEAYADDDLLSDVRVGVATGPVLMREGDFFGSVVNRAHRTTSIADAGTVLCGEEVYEEVSAESLTHDVTWEALKPRELKDIGTVCLWSVRRTDRLEATEERRTGTRWRRLSSLSSELSDLREIGEGAVEAVTSTSRSTGS
jgi:adenylate cyclase